MDKGLAKRIQQRMASMVSESVKPMTGGEESGGNTLMLPIVAFCLVFLATVAVVHLCSEKKIVPEKKD